MDLNVNVKATVENATSRNTRAGSSMYDDHHIRMDVEMKARPVGLHPQEDDVRNVFHL